MEFKRKGILCCFLVVSLFMFGCDSSDSTPEWNKPEAVETGKLSQGYVENAMVIADKITSSGYGNFELDQGEVFTFSDAGGNYRLEIPKYYGGYVLLTLGGKVKDSKGAASDAFPMLASSGARNITPVTTLAVLSSEFKSKIGADYDVDIAGPSGAPWNIMKVAKAVETALALFTDKNNPILSGVNLQMAVMKKLAVELAKREVNASDTDSIQNAVYSAVSAILSDSTLVSYETYLNAFGISNVVMTGVEDVLASIPNSGFVTENSIQPSFETIVSSALIKLSGGMLAFDPAKSVIPFPNDAAWGGSSVPAERRGLVTLDPAAASDIPTKALYMAVNHLNIRGLSPNAPIGIPLANSTKIKPDALQNSIKVVNLTKLFGVLYSALKLGDPAAASADAVKTGVITALTKLAADDWTGIQKMLSTNPIAGMIFHQVKAYQDGTYIKAIPLTPLDPGSTYLVYIEDKLEDPFDDFTDVNGIKVKQAPYYRYLKSDSELKDSLAALEELRKNYAPIYSYLLKAFGLGKDDTLEIFTFTTADKTLSLADAAAIGAAVQTNNLDLLSGLTKEGLPYSQIRSEYELFNNALHYQIQTSPSVTPKTFASFDVTKLGSNPPATLSVPYTVSNASAYTDTVVVFQHGLGQKKETGNEVAKLLNYPVLSMDLPLHGDRTVSGKSYFSPDMLTTRINLYQSLFDMSLFVKSIKSGLFDINGDNTPDTPAKIFFVGHSLGSITGSMMNAYVSDADKIVLIAGGAAYSSIFDVATCALVRNTVTLERNTTQYFVSLGILQLLIDPADPAYQASSSYKNKTLILTAHMDTYVPNISNEILCRTIGYLQPAAIANFSGFNPLEVKNPGWYHYGNSPSLTANWIPHEFMLNDNTSYPEAAGYFDQAYVNSAHQAAKAQIIAFLNN